MVKSETPQQLDVQGGPEVLVTISYAASRQGRWEEKASADTPLSVVRDAAMAFFGVVDHVDSAGNGEVYELMDRGTTFEDLSVTIGNLADTSGNLALRLVRRLVAG
ncbi:MAG: hypothetical protein F4X98_15230 [Gammaproteobacteria bacterium]|nr:hypothetical protein [Gammaproteobacteria bacterium]